MVFSQFTELSHHPYPQVVYFRHSSKISFLKVNPHSHPQPQATTHVFSASKLLPLLHLVYQWNHRTCGLLYLASFI